MRILESMQMLGKTAGLQEPTLSYHARDVCIYIYTCIYKAIGFQLFHGNYHTYRCIYICTQQTIRFLIIVAKLESLHSNPNNFQLCRPRRLPPQALEEQPRSHGPQAAWVCLSCKP